MRRMQIGKPIPMPSVCSTTIATVVNYFGKERMSGLLEMR